MNSSPDPTEQAKIREQFRDFESEKYLLAMKVYAEQSHAQRMNAFIFVKEYGLQTVRYLFILNGASVLALLSLIGAIIAKSDEKTLLIAISFSHALRPAFILFGIGLVFAGLLAASTYRNWLAIADNHQNPKQILDLINVGKTDPLPDNNVRLANWMARAGYVCGLLSLIAFICGAWVVAEAFGILGA